MGAGACAANGLAHLCTCRVHGVDDMGEAAWDWPCHAHGLACLCACWGVGPEGKAACRGWGVCSQRCPPLRPTKKQRKAYNTTSPSLTPAQPGPQAHYEEARCPGQLVFGLEQPVPGFTSLVARCATCQGLQIIL